MLSLSQRLAQTQKLSPQQIQYQKLLQLNTLALEQRIKTELEMNPVLEEEMEMNLEQDDKEKDSDTETEIEDEYSDKDNEEFALEDYMNDDDFDHERINRSPDEEMFQPLAPQRETLSEHLTEQLRLLNLDEDLYILGEEIVGNLDEDGYLKRELPEILNELEMFEHIKIEPQTAEDLLKRIQKFDPIGIASRNLKECLIVQLRESKSDPYNKYLAIKMLEDHYDEFTKRRFDLIKQRMNMTDESLKDTVELIQTMNPKPGEGNISSMEMNQVTPDFIVEKVDENWVITLNDKSMPSVTISKQYLEMFNSNKRLKETTGKKKLINF